MSRFQTGRKLPISNTVRRTRSRRLATVIAGALQSELGGSRAAIKTVMRWTLASERTVKSWLAGEAAPRGSQLIDLMKESHAVLIAVLVLAGRESKIADRPDEESAAMPLGSQRHVVGGNRSRDDFLLVHHASGHRNRRDDGTINVTKRDINRTGFVESADRAASGPNLRQAWFLDKLRSSDASRAGDIARNWGVSIRTAKRDVAHLLRRGLIVFVGSRRIGKYRRNE